MLNNVINLSTTSELEKIFNDQFKEYFMKNYLWIIILLIIIGIILLIHLLMHLFSNKYDIIENKFNKINKQIQKLEYDLFLMNNSTINESKQTTLEDISKQLQELKDKIEK